MGQVLTEPLSVKPIQHEVQREQKRFLICSVQQPFNFTWVIPPHRVSAGTLFPPWKAKFSWYTPFSVWLPHPPVWKCWWWLTGLSINYWGLNIQHVWVKMAGKSFMCFILKHTDIQCTQMRVMEKMEEMIETWHVMRRFFNLPKQPTCVHVRTSVCV